MNYHINTILIWDSFKQEGCPLCRIRQQVESRAVSLYLNEAVMDDNCRALVNKYGFCAAHFKKLYEGDNKLGLALQAHTRLKFLEKQMDSFKPLGHNNCVICKIIDMHIEKYCSTISDMFIDDVNFKKVFLNCSGFCIPHYNKLISLKGKKQYKKELKRLQHDRITAMCGSLEQFTDKYSASNNDKPSDNIRALKDSINIMCGNIIE